MVPRGEGRGLRERAGVGQHVLGDRQAAGREGSREREVRRDGKTSERTGTGMKLQYLSTYSEPEVEGGVHTWQAGVRGVISERDTHVSLTEWVPWVGNSSISSQLQV